jgi:hypothetical protein
LLVGVVVAVVLAVVAVQVDYLPPRDLPLLLAQALL